MIKCVLVDDERNALEMMEWLLKTYCPQVEIVAMCNSAELGIEAINRHKPDVVFLDIEMPKMNGFEVARAIKQIRPNIKLAFITAFDINKSEFEKVLPSTKVDAFVTKPVRPSTFAETIKEAIKH